MRARVGVLSNCQRGVGSWRQAWRAGGLAAERQPPHVVAGVCARTQGTPTDASTSNRQEVVDWSTIRSAHGRVCQSHGRHLHGHLNGSGAIVEGGIKQTGKFNPWSGSSPIAELLLQLAKKRCHLRPSRPGWPWAASIACARKAHKVEDDVGAEACSGAPQAACLTTLATLRPLLGVSDPWYQISFLALGRRSRHRRAAAASGRRGTTRFFGTGSRVPMDWAALAIKPGRQSLNRTSMDGRRAQVAIFQTGTGRGQDVASPLLSTSPLVVPTIKRSRRLSPVASLRR